MSDQGSCLSRSKQQGKWDPERSDKKSQGQEEGSEGCCLTLASSSWEVRKFAHVPAPGSDSYSRRGLGWGAAVFLGDRSIRGDAQPGGQADTVACFLPGLTNSEENRMR